MKGYIVLNSNNDISESVCKDKRDYNGKTIYHARFNFYTDLIALIEESELDSTDWIAEIDVIGEVSKKDGTNFTNKFVLANRVTYQDVIRMMKSKKDNNTSNRNTGDNNAGYYNTGNYNSGNYNKGNRNTGYYNTGNYNSGNYNKGNRNTGYYNTGNYNSGYYNTSNRNTGDNNAGYYNTGNYNSGNYNKGNRNTGNCNKTSFSNGMFCTIEPNILMFNKPVDITYRDWIGTDAHKIISRIGNYCTTFIVSCDMSEEEKRKNPNHEKIGGYLKVVTLTDAYKEWWANLYENEKSIICDMPNFDSDIFKEITGIDIND